MITKSLFLFLDFSYATVQEVGGHWGLSCSPPPSLKSSVTALTWETAEGVELARSTSPDALSYTAAVRDSDHHRGLVCFNWIGEQRVYALYVTLIVQGINGTLGTSVMTSYIGWVMRAHRAYTCHDHIAFCESLMNTSCKQASMGYSKYSCEILSRFMKSGEFFYSSCSKQHLFIHDANKEYVIASILCT